MIPPSLAYGVSDPRYSGDGAISSFTAAGDGIETKEQGREKSRLSFKEGAARVCLQTKVPALFGKMFPRNVCTYFSGKEGDESHIL